MKMPGTKLEESGQSLPPALRFAKPQKQVGGFRVVEQRNAAHRLRAACKHCFCFAKLNQLRCRGDCFQAGGTIAMDAVRYAILWNATGESDHAGDICSF